MHTLRRASIPLLRQLLFLVLLAASGCATVPQGEHTVALEVENGLYEDIRVFLIRQGTAIRLGVVEGLGVRTFRLSPAQLGMGSDVVLRAESRGSRVVVVSPSFELPLGRSVGWTLRGRGTLSSLEFR